MAEKIITEQRTGTVTTIRERVAVDTTPVNLSSAPLEIIAHRGFASQAPQNTLIAMSAALKRGANSLECDLQPSADSTIYLFHDVTVDALTDGTGTFTGLTDATIDGLTFTALVGTPLESVQITKASEFFRFAREAGVKVYPEIKAYNAQADISLMMGEVIAAKMENLTLFQSGTLSDLQYIRDNFPTSPVGVGLIGTSTDSGVYEPAIDNVSALSGLIIWEYNSLLSTPAIVDYAFSKGVDVIAWTVPDRTSASALMRIGVNKIMTDTSIGRFD